MGRTVSDVLAMAYSAHDLNNCGVEEKVNQPWTWAVDQPHSLTPTMPSGHFLHCPKTDVRFVYGGGTATLTPL